MYVKPPWHATLQSELEETTVTGCSSKINKPSYPEDDFNVMSSLIDYCYISQIIEARATN